VLPDRALPDEMRSDLVDIQHDLFDLARTLHPGYTMVQRRSGAARCPSRALQRKPAPLAEFILPGDLEPRPGACQPHGVPAAERAFVALGAAEAVNSAPRHYLNRLSDLLFVLARTLNRHAGAATCCGSSARNAAPRRLGGLIRCSSPVRPANAHFVAQRRGPSQPAGDLRRLRKLAPSLRAAADSGRKP